MRTVLTNTAVVNLTILVLCVIAFLVISYKIVRLNRPGLLICYIFLVLGGIFWGAKHYKIQSLSDLFPKEQQREKTFEEKANMIVDPNPKKPIKEVEKPKEQKKISNF